MKPLQALELKASYDYLKQNLGALVSEVLCFPQGLGLRFFGKKLRWVFVDLKVPTIVFWPEDKPPKLSKEKPPFFFFAKAHLKGLKLVEVDWTDKQPKILKLRFESWRGRKGGQDGGTEEAKNDIRTFNLELRLFAQGKNVIGSTVDKSISWNKVKKLSEAKFELKPEALGNKTRSFDEILGEWLKQNTSLEKKVKQNQNQGQKKSLLKTQDKILKSLEILKKQPWQKVGEWIKANQHLEVPKFWEKFVNTEETLAWNIQNCFEKNKKVQVKIQGAQKRLAEIKGQITSADVVKESVSPDSSWLKKAGIKGRSLKITQETRAFAGLSGADNLKLLRKAKPWFVWGHIKDEPGSHVVIQKEKKTSLSDETLKAVGRWLVGLMRGKRQRSGLKYEVIFAECRYVRPIKGARPGAVTYQKARVLRV